MDSNEKREEIGEIILTAVQEQCHFEQEQWAVEKVERVNIRLQSVRPNRPPLKVHIPWLTEPTAFTAPGSHIFISRSLFQMLQSDDQIAFVIAHEMAHHDLGHIDVFPDWLGRAAPVDMHFLLLALYRVVETLIYGSETECEADAYAIELCHRAGYDVEKSASIFEILTKLALDMGAVHSVFGAIDPDDDSWSTKIRNWLFEKQTGYLSIVDRHKFINDNIQDLGISKPA